MDSEDISRKLNIDINWKKQCVGPCENCPARIGSFFVAMIVLVEIYLRLEDRLLTAGNKSFIVTDDVPPFPAGLGNLTRVYAYLNYLFLFVRPYILEKSTLKFEFGFW